MDNKKLIAILLDTISKITPVLSNGIHEVNEESVLKDFKKVGEIHPIVSDTMVKLIKIGAILSGIEADLKEAK